MEVILKENIKNLGVIGDIVNVKPGFARNFLIPNNKALYATKSNIELLNQHKHHLEQLHKDNLLKAQEVAKEIKDKPFIFIRSGSETGSLYGSVSAKNIIENLSKGGLNITFSQVELPHQIKSFGCYDVKIHLHSEVTTNIIVIVARNEEDAENSFKSYTDKKSKKDASVETKNKEESTNAEESVAEIINNN